LIFGRWSAAALVFSMACWFFFSTSHGQLLERCNITRLQLQRVLPWIFMLLSLHLGWRALDSMTAFSGSAQRYYILTMRKLDLYVAWYITLLFGFAFAVDCLRDPVLRRRFLTLLCMAVYLLLIVVGIFAGYAVRAAR
jgi:hypothetical protein